MFLRILPIIALLLIPPAAVADTVTVASGPEGRARYERQGEVLDYTGRTLTLRLPSGQTVDIQSDTVVAVEATLSEAQAAGDRALAAGDYAQAMEHYQQVRDEQRRWVRRLLGANMAVALDGLGHPDKAGAMFLAVIADDPTTPYLNRIPLTWTGTARIDPAVARQWMDQTNNPVAVLLGASHLLTTPQRASAAQVLKRLRNHTDPRIAALAEAQWFRTQAAAADAEELERFAQQVEQMPEAFRGGAYFVLGRGNAQAGERQKGAAALMRVPILFPEQRVLASESLLLSGKLLAEQATAESIAEEMQQELRASAGRLYRELLTDYPDSPAAQEARQRLDELGE